MNTLKYNRWSALCFEIPDTQQFYSRYFVVG